MYGFKQNKAKKMNNETVTSDKSARSGDWQYPAQLGSRLVNLSTKVQCHWTVKYTWMSNGWAPSVQHWILLYTTWQNWLQDGTQQQQPPFYGHYTVQPALAGTSSWLVQSFTARMLLLMATSARLLDWVVIINLCRTTASENWQFISMQLVNDISTMPTSHICLCFVKYHNLAVKKQCAR